MSWDLFRERTPYLYNPELFPNPIPFPDHGDRVRITLGRDVQSWHEQQRIVLPAGKVYEGIVTEADTEGFFEILDTAGMPMKFYLGDSALHIEVTAAVRP